MPTQALLASGLARAAWSTLGRGVQGWAPTQAASRSAPRAARRSGRAMGGHLRCRPRSPHPCSGGKPTDDPEGAARLEEAPQGACGTRHKSGDRGAGVAPDVLTRRWCGEAGGPCGAGCELTAVRGLHKVCGRALAKMRRLAGEGGWRLRARGLGGREQGGRDGGRRDLIWAKGHDVAPPTRTSAPTNNFSVTRFKVWTHVFRRRLTRVWAGFARSAKKIFSTLFPCGNCSI